MRGESESDGDYGGVVQSQGQNRGYPVVLGGCPGHGAALAARRLDVFARRLVGLEVPLYARKVDPPEVTVAWEVGVLLGCEAGGVM